MVLGIAAGLGKEDLLRAIGNSVAGDCSSTFSGIYRSKFAKTRYRSQLYDHENTQMSPDQRNRCNVPTVDRDAPTVSRTELYELS